MKKIYITPTAKSIELGLEGNTLQNTSLTVSTETIDNENEVWTQRQETNGNSLWDTWSN